MRRLYLFFLLLIFISSCKTFDFAKRRYNDGYYVDADSKMTARSSSERKKSTGEKSKPQTTVNEEAQPAQDAVSANGYDAPAEQIKNDEKLIASNELSKISGKLFSLPPLEKFDAPGNSKKLELFSVLSFLIGLSAIVWVAVFGILGAALTAIILGIIGRYRVRKHAERYKAKGLWAVGVAFGIIILVYIAIVLATTNQTEVRIFN